MRSRSLSTLASKVVDTIGADRLRKTAAHLEPGLVRRPAASRTPGINRAFSVVALCVAVIAVDEISGRQRITAATTAAVLGWKEAVLHHTPGQADAALEWIRTLSRDRARSEELNGGIGKFLDVIVGKGVVISSPEEKALVDLASATQVVGARVFLERAAVLHADSAMLDYGAPLQSPDGRGGVLERSSTPPFRAGNLVIANDGEYRREVPSNWNWVFARSVVALVTQVERRPTDDAFIGVWYHATATFMLGNRLFGEAQSHLEEAARLLPNDARIMFDRACLSETLGLPESQQLLTSEDLVALRLARQPNVRVLPNQPKVGRTAALAGIPPEEVANADAERSFRRALAVDPTLVEARVRLARLLEIRKSYSDARTQLVEAINRTADPIVSFYAHLVAGRVEAALNENESAAQHIQQARALFPEAQSALLAESHLALIRADASGALAPIRDLARLASAAAQRTDPWWRYDIGPGRNADTIVREMWTMAAALR